jgi:hypothetical protein
MGLVRSRKTQERETYRGTWRGWRERARKEGLKERTDGGVVVDAEEVWVTGVGGAPEQGGRRPPDEREPWSETELVALGCSARQDAAG